MPRTINTHLLFTAMSPTSEILAYDSNPPMLPKWLNKGDNAWQMIGATLVGLQSMPGLVILYGSIVKKKWAVNSAFMALYAFASSLLVWVLVGYRMAFGEELLPFWGKAGPALGQSYLVRRSHLPATAHYFNNGTLEMAMVELFFPQAALVIFEFAYAAITLILLAGSVLGRMNIKAWMAFSPLWLVFSYTVGAFSLWGGGFLYQWGVMDYSGGYVIHLSSGISGFTAAYWVGPRLKCDKERFSPNNILLMITGAGLLWMGWSGFNGGEPFSAGITAAIAVLNTHICATTSLLVWTFLDVIFFEKPSVIGAIQGMMTGLVCITAGSGLVHSWAALLMGIVSGSIPWFTMMILHKKSAILQKVDDTLGVFHTHAIAGLIGGLMTGLLAIPELCDDDTTSIPGQKGTAYGGGIVQMFKQLIGAIFIIVWNVFTTTVLLLIIGMIIPLRMPDDELLIGDDAAHGEEAYALWGDGEKFDATRHETIVHHASVNAEDSVNSHHNQNGCHGVTIQL
ncbi:Ammonium transporter [Rhynchospora pubera]|uniref:Ammonium transporter n=1 Tax=Rhynchospora pubera TaxID=906938 RepID=A0AAV8FYP5_9POAL|nr:Ammonium transporter [Rhynchospora pubera]